MLAQCTALAEINLEYNQIGPAGAESLAGVLTQCTALAHLEISRTITWALSGKGDFEGRGAVRGSWRGQASGLILEEEV